MAQKPADTAPYVHDFQSFILERISINEPLVQGVKKAEHLVDLERIDALLTMLEWREGDAQWLDWTRYMEIEHVIGVDRDGKETTVNEYKELPVLPTPQGVVRRARQGSAGAAMPPAAPAPATSRPVDRPHPAGGSPAGVEHGTVKVYGKDGKPFGFIKPDSGDKDVFVHRDGLAPGLSSLREGQRVTFKRVPGKEPGKFRAVDVRIEN